MSHIEANRIGILLEDGTELGPYRLGVAAQIEWSKHARVRGFDVHDSVRSGAFMTWWTAKNKGHLTMELADFYASDTIVGEWVDSDETATEAETETGEMDDPIYRATSAEASSPSPSAAESATQLG